MSERVWEKDGMAASLHYVPSDAPLDLDPEERRDVEERGVSLEEIRRNRFERVRLCFERIAGERGYTVAGDTSHREGA